MGISYAGVPLPAITPDAVQWVEQNVPPSEIFNFERLEISGKDRIGWSREVGPALPPLKLGTLYYPANRTDRWATGFFLGTDNTLAQIFQVIFSSGVMSSAPLVLSSESGSLSTPMFLLPPRPLTQMPGGNGLYLLTFVDERYGWWLSSAGAVNITESGVSPSDRTTWADLYNQVISQNPADVKLTVGNINPVYLYPSAGLSHAWEPISVFLQTLANNTGRRLVRNLDGSYTALTPDDSSVTEESNLEDLEKLVSGGFFQWERAPLPSVQALNLSTPTFFNFVTPQTVSCPDHGTTFVPNGSYAVSVGTLSSIDALVPLYSGVVGNGGVKTVHDTVLAAYPCDPTPIAVANINGDGTTVSLQTSQAHPFQVGDVVRVRGSNLSGYNTTGTVATVADNTHLTFPSTALGINTSVNVTVQAVALNSAELDALAVQAATDWWKWKYDYLDVRINGIYSWEPEGRHDIIWTCTETDSSTHVFPRPWNDTLEQLNHSGTYGSLARILPGSTYLEFSNCVNQVPIPDGGGGGGGGNVNFNCNISLPSDLSLIQGTTNQYQLDSAAFRRGPVILANMPAGAVITDITPPPGNPIENPQPPAFNSVPDPNWGIIYNSGTTNLMFSDGSSNSLSSIQIPRMFSRIEYCQFNSTPPPPGNHVMILQPGDSAFFWWNICGTGGWKVLFSSAEPTSLSGAGGQTRVLISGSCVDFGSGVSQGTLNPINIFNNLYYYGVTNSLFQSNFYGGVNLYGTTVMNGCFLADPISMDVGSGGSLNLRNTCALVIKLTGTTAGVTLSSIDPGFDRRPGKSGSPPRIIFLYNASAGDIKLQAGGNTAGGFTLPGGCDLTLQVSGGIGLYLDAASDKWVPLTVEAGGTNETFTVLGSDCTPISLVCVNGRIQPSTNQKCHETAGLSPCNLAFGTPAPNPPPPAKAPVNNVCCQRDIGQNLFLIQSVLDNPIPLPAADEDDDGTINLWGSQTNQNCTDKFNGMPNGAALPSLGFYFAGTDGVLYGYSCVVACNKGNWTIRLVLFTFNSDGSVRTQQSFGPTVVVNPQCGPPLVLTARMALPAGVLAVQEEGQ